MLARDSLGMVGHATRAGAAVAHSRSVALM
jgi:hypothetical protein